MKDTTKVKAVNVGKVAKVKAENPNATYIEIKKETGLSPATISKATQELKQNGTKDETIAYIVGKSKDRIKKVQQLFDRYINEVEEKDKLDRPDVALVKDIVKDDLQRVTVFGGTITDEEGGLKDLSNLAPQELERQLNILLGR